MIKSIVRSLAMALALTGSTAFAQSDEFVQMPQAASINTLTAQLIANDRSVVGTATFQQGPLGLLIRIEVDGLEPGWHGAHLHQIGDCSSSDFASSGSHINPRGGLHGLLNPDGPDNADLPNLYVHTDGRLRAEVYTQQISLDGQTAAPSLLDANGSALVIHQNEDDHTTQQIGGAGPRIVCGVVTDPD